jgi:hypothetical protein
MAKAKPKQAQAPFVVRRRSRIKVTPIELDQSPRSSFRPQAGRSIGDAQGRAIRSSSGRLVKGRGDLDVGVGSGTVSAAADEPNTRTRRLAPYERPPKGLKRFGRA